MKNPISRIFLWIYRKSTEDRFDTSKRKLSLDELIQRVEARMYLKPLCPFCNIPMLFRTSHVVEGDICRDDVAYKCTRCFHTLHFGIPISKELVKEEIDLRGSHQIMQPTAFKIEHDDEVKQRLRALGYLME